MSSDPIERPITALTPPDSHLDSGLRDLSLEDFKKYFTPPTAEEARDTAEWYRKYQPQAEASMEWMKKLITGDEPLEKLLTEFPMKDKINPEVWQKSMNQLEHLVLQWAGDRNPTIKFGLMVDDALKHGNPTVAKFAQTATNWMSEAGTYLTEQAKATTKGIFK